MNMRCFKKISCLALAAILTAALLPVPEARAAETDLAAIVEQQIRAFADSIDKANADDDAASALAKHGITGGGKKLSVGKSHALTATLMNSELLQTVLAGGCAAAIDAMQNTEQASLCAAGACFWYDRAGSSSFLFAVTGDEWVQANLDLKVLRESLDFYILREEKNSSRPWNDYDDALDWMAGTTLIDLYVKRSKVTTDATVYQVTCSVNDRFDFDTASDSFFKELLGFLGALFFKEFDWKATVTFELTVPYSCTHSSGAYRWSYDAESRTLTTDGSDGYTPNEVTRHTGADDHGAETYYYELEQTIHLRYDRPWVMEYDVCKPGDLVFSFSERLTGAVTQPSLWYLKQDGFFTGSRRYNSLDVNAPFIYDWYGISKLDSYFDCDTSTVTFRLENEINADGNMIWLSVFDTGSGEPRLDRIPMNDYFQMKSGQKTPVAQNEKNNWVSGKDFYINYIGNVEFPFSAEEFDLRIWENGEEGGGESLCTKKVTKPTCTAKGYTTYTCAACGYSYKADSVKAKGHSYKTAVTAPTCTEDGYTTYTCSTCKDSYTEPIPATGHDRAAGLCTACGDDALTVTLEGTTFTLSGELAEGTRILAACYDGDGRFTGTEVFLWQGAELTGQLPESGEVRIFFADGTHAPLRDGLRLR